jgi:hypothetical protein
MKEQVDFCLIYVDKKNTIQWKDGRVEKVTDAKLQKLQSNHSWATDF